MLSVIFYHNCVRFNIEANKGKNPQKEITFRKTCGINIPQFKKEIKQHLSQQVQHHNRSSQLNKLVQIYKSTEQVFNKHAPEITKLVTLRKPTPFTNADIKQLKTSKRKAERRWRRTGLESDWNVFKDKRNALNDHLNQLKAEDLRSKIQKTKGNSRAMFKILNSNLNRKQELPLPHHNNETELANDFNMFFDEKIKKIRSKLDSTKQCTSDKAKTNTSFKFSQFKALSDNEVKKLIMNMPVKHCKLDPLPTWLVLECIDEFLPIITKIVNISLTTGEMPYELKHALVRPLLKKAGLDFVKKNLRPESN